MHLEAAVSVELDSRSQAGNLLVVLGGDVCEDGVLSGRDLLGKLDVLGQGGLALLDRALEVDVLDLVAEVGILLDDGDQAVLDLQVHLRAIFDVLRKVTAGHDAEDLTTVAWGQRMYICVSRRLIYLRLRRVGVQVDALEVEDIILWVVAVVQRVVAGNGERVVEGDLGATEEGAGRRSCEDRGGNSEELHLVVCLWCGVYQ